MRLPAVDNKQSDSWRVIYSMEIFSESGVTGLPDNLHIQQ